MKTTRSYKTPNNSIKCSFPRILLLLLFLLKIEPTFFPLASYRAIYLFLFILALGGRKSLRLGKYDIFFIGINILMLSLSLFRSPVTKDIIIARYHFETILNILSAYIILEIFYKKLSLTILIYEIVYAVLIQSLVMIVMLLNADIKTLINSLFPSGIDRSRWGWRHMGLTGFTAYNMGILLALAFSLSFFLFVKQCVSFRKLVFLSVCFISTSFIAARSSYIAFFFFGCYFMRFIKRGRIIIFIAFIVILFIITYICLYTRSLNDKNFKYIFDWMFSLINDIIFNKKSLINNHSVRVISDNFYWLPDPQTFLIGDGRYAPISGEGYYMSTDAGYMRRLLYYGIFASAIYYVSFAFYVVVIIKSSNRYTDIAGLLIVMIIIAFFMQYKGDFFIDAGEYFRLFFLLEGYDFVAGKSRLNNIAQ